MNPDPSRQLPHLSDLTASGQPQLREATRHTAHDDASALELTYEARYLMAAFTDAGGQDYPPVASPATARLNEQMQQLCIRMELRLPRVAPAMLPVLFESYDFLYRFAYGHPTPEAIRRRSTARILAAWDADAQAVAPSFIANILLSLLPSELTPKQRNWLSHRLSEWSRESLPASRESLSASRLSVTSEHLRRLDLLRRASALGRIPQDTLRSLSASSHRLSSSLRSPSALASLSDETLLALLNSSLSWPSSGLPEPAKIYDALLRRPSLHPRLRMALRLESQAQ